MSPTHVDTDQDGFGNWCDGDFDQDGSVGASDFIALSSVVSGGSASDDRFDLNGDGAFDDLDGDCWLLLANAPEIGPSGLFCADPIIDINAPDPVDPEDPPNTPCVAP